MSNYHVGKTLTISSIQFLLLRNARTNISLQHRLLLNRNKLPNTCIRNNLWPSARRLISSEVPIRDLRVISGMWKTSVNCADWYSSRWQRLTVDESQSRLKSPDGVDQFPKKKLDVVLVSLQRTLHIDLRHSTHRRRRDDNNDFDITDDAQRRYRRTSPPVEFASAISHTVSRHILISGMPTELLRVDRSANIN